jgi:aryl-alcohol dehydrogenase-like predicted oxidoreductase
MQRGLLTGKIKPGHIFNEGDTRPDTPYFKEPNLSNINKFLDKIRPVADGHNASLSQLVLNWTISQPGITCALAGARNPSQVVDNAGAAAFILTEEEINIINKHISDLSIVTKF